MVFDAHGLGIGLELHGPGLDLHGIYEDIDIYLPHRGLDLHGPVLGLDLHGPSIDLEINLPYGHLPGAGLDIHKPSVDINGPPMTGGANKFPRRCGIQSTDSSRSKIRNSSCRYTCKTSTYRSQSNRISTRSSK